MKNTSNPKNLAQLSFLGQCLSDREHLKNLQKILTKIQKCCDATDAQMNLADILHAADNRGSLGNTFGMGEYLQGMQILTNLALEGYEALSITTSKDIVGTKKFDFLHRSVGGWKQFDTVITFQVPDKFDLDGFTLLNPIRRAHYKDLQSLPAETLITIYVRTARGPRSYNQERLLLDRYKSIFDVLQNQGESTGAGTPVVELARKQPSTENHSQKKKRRHRPHSPFASVGAAQVDTDGAPVAVSKVVINKADTFVHAGNAQLILQHCQEYPGVISLFVLRDKKQKVLMDADSIWGAEIRNGETVLFEFYGPEPTDEFLKDMARQVNKYTQMDKLG